MSRTWIMTQRIIFCNLVFTKFKNIFNKDWMTCKNFFWIWLRFPRDITVESKCLILTPRCYNFKLCSRNSMSPNKLLQKIWLFFKKLQEVIIKKTALTLGCHKQKFHVVIDTAHLWYSLWPWGGFGIRSLVFRANR